MSSLYIDEMECNVLKKAIKIMREKSPCTLNTVQDRELQLCIQSFNTAPGGMSQKDSTVCSYSSREGDSAQGIKCLSCSLVVTVGRTV